MSIKLEGLAISGGFFFVAASLRYLLSTLQLLGGQQYDPNHNYSYRLLIGEAAKKSRIELVDLENILKTNQGN